MRFAFASRSSPAELDFRGFDPSALTDLTYCFSGCSSLVTIYADATGRCLRAGFPDSAVLL